MRTLRSAPCVSVAETVFIGFDQRKSDAKILAFDVGSYIVEFRDPVKNILVLGGSPFRRYVPRFRIDPRYGLLLYQRMNERHARFFKKNFKLLKQRVQRRGLYFDYAVVVLYIGDVTEMRDFMMRAVTVEVILQHKMYPLFVENADAVFFVSDPVMLIADVQKKRLVDDLCRVKRLVAFSMYHARDWSHPRSSSKCSASRFPPPESVSRSTFSEPP